MVGPEESPEPEPEPEAQGRAAGGYYIATSSPERLHHLMTLSQEEFEAQPDVYPAGSPALGPDAARQRPPVPDRTGVRLRATEAFWQQAAAEGSPYRHALAATALPLTVDAEALRDTWWRVEVELQRQAPALHAALRHSTAEQVALLRDELGPHTPAWLFDWFLTVPYCEVPDEGHLFGALLGPLSAVAAAREHHLSCEVFDDVDALVATLEAQAGGPAFAWLPQFVPVAGGEVEWFVDPRAGDQRGCVREYIAEMGALDAPVARGLVGLLEALLAALRGEGELDQQVPFPTDDGWLGWTQVDRPA